MRVAMMSHYDTKQILKIIKQHGFVLSKKPQFVFTYGGDGTILQAENKYPGVPLIPIQRSNICSNCSVYSNHSLYVTLHALRRGTFTIKEEPKIEALFRKNILTALNEIQVHVKDPSRALRFSLRSGSKKYKELIGDGFVASTSYGSTAYYRALGYEPFKKGIRVGFNNVWPRLPSLNLKTSLHFKLLRGDAWIVVDNTFKASLLRNESFIIRASKRKARFVTVKK